MRVLLISNTSPVPMRNGGQQRTHHLLEALRRVGTVDFLLIPRYAPPDERQLAEIRARCGNVEVVATRQRGEVRPWIWLRRFAPELVDRLANAVGDRRFYYRVDAAASAAVRVSLDRSKYDVVVVRYAQSAGTSGILDTARPPVIVDIDDLDTHVVATNLADSTGHPIKQLMFKRQLRQLRMVLPGLLAKADHCWVTTPEDGAAVASGRSSILPNIPLIEPKSPTDTPTTTKRIVLVGNMYFRPNAEGAEFFVKEVWPLIREIHPAAEFRIVGPGLDQHLASVWQKIPGISIVGWVDRVAPEYEAATLAVVPVFAGGGTKIKVLESLAYGRVCVVSSHSLRGYERDLKHGESLFVADDPKLFAEHCSRLIDRPSECREMAQRGKRIVESAYSTERFAQLVQRDIAAVISASVSSVA